VTRDRSATVWRVLAALGIADADLLPLGAGLASEAWRVGHSSPWYALRVARERPDAVSTYEMEHRLLGLLADGGARVPRPLRGSWQVDGWDGPAFSLTLGLDGAPLPPADHGRVVPAIASFLRTLHGLVIEGCGAVMVTDGGLRGTAADMDSGLRQWAIRPLWPLGGARLDVHAALSQHAQLAERIEAHSELVREALLRGPGVPLHSDLHEENILDDDGVPGFIDFGEALVGPAAWEFASLAYFLGWPMADGILAAYLVDGQELEARRHEASLVALCFGVYRWAQDRDLAEDRDDEDESFLRETLDRVARQT